MTVYRGRPNRHDNLLEVSRAHRRVRSQGMLATGFVFLVGILIVLALALGVGGWRDSRIQACKDRGGQPVTYDVFSDRYMEVSCIEVGR